MQKKLRQSRAEEKCIQKASLRKSGRAEFAARQAERVRRRLSEAKHGDHETKFGKCANCQDVLVPDSKEKAVMFSNLRNKGEPIFCAKCYGSKMQARRASRTSHENYQEILRLYKLLNDHHKKCAARELARLYDEESKIKERFGVKQVADE